MSAARALADDMDRPPVWPCGEPPLKDFATKIAADDVTISGADARAMAEIVAAVHAVVATPSFEEAALVDARSAARARQRVRGVFSGFDFHLTPDGPRLIEINTNAGGAFYGALIDDERWRRGDVRAMPLGVWAHAFVQHFRAEWAHDGKGVLRTIAIVDDSPNDQFLRLEFHLAARILHEAGIEAVIADPRELAFREGRLWLGATAIDLVYNRLTSFALDRDADEAVREAMLAGAVVVTPDPRTHALLARKRNLVLLGDEAFLRGANVDAHTRETLHRAVPHTVLLTSENASSLWLDRARHYFKPDAGFGSRAVYDGAKLTAKTWRELTSSDYVAQARIDPPRVEIPEFGTMRFDVRTFAYGASPFMRLARVYRGQTTNFRTPGGGFAAVRVVDKAAEA